MADTVLRDFYQRRVSSLRTERQSFIDHWKSVAEFIKPRRGRFFTSDRNKGDRRWASIINSRGTQALRIARAGLLSGTMSPSRPWFLLVPYDKALLENHAVQTWLYKVRDIILEVFNDSNFYNMVPTLLEELVLFGTGAMFHVDDFDDVARFYTHTAGSYMIDQNERFQVRTFAREYEATVEQLIGQFGKSNVSMSVKDKYDKGDYGAWYPVVHIITPNPRADAGRVGIRNAAFRSAYYEPGNNDKDKFLEQSGFYEFPVYTPRWELTGEDIYATNCPAMTALGDIKGLQMEERRKAQAIDKQVNPPLHGPTSLQNRPVSSLPGGINLYDTGPDSRGLRPVYEVTPDLRGMMEDINAVERRIDDAFYVNLFLAITAMEGIQPRNQMELSERNQERLLQLGPVLEQLHGELLNQAVTRVFNQCDRAGVLPDAPKELQSKPLKVRYISALAMAQRAVATTGIERVAAFTTSLVAAQLSDGKKFNADQAVGEYAQAIGTPPGIIVPDDIVAEQRQAEQQAALAQQQTETMQALANAGQAAANSKLDDDNVLSRFAGRS